MADAYFERMYDGADDPWGFDTRWYERRKYALTLAALPNERYARVFEPGCSFGALSERLASRCDALVASELIPAVADRARERLARFDHVQVVTAPIPEYWPEGEFDLVLLSEVLYYLNEAGARELWKHVEESTREGAHLIAVHYRGATNYPVSGDRAHDWLRSRARLRSIGRYEEASFLLELFERVGA
jgi:trans-aconitate methyltransferase